MKMKAGDAVRMHRKNKDYYQFGIYLGNDEVMTLVEEKNKKGKVMKVTMKEFKKKTGNVEVVDFPEIKNGKITYVKAEELHAVKGLIRKGTWATWFVSLFEEYGVNTRKETLHKAKSKTGNTQDVNFNNSEHFAWWCKIGLKRADFLTDTVDKYYNTNPRQERFALPKIKTI